VDYIETRNGESIHFNNAVVRADI
jgi:hypothetical protein